MVPGALAAAFAFHSCGLEHLGARVRSRRLQVHAHAGWEFWVQGIELVGVGRMAINRIRGQWRGDQLDEGRINPARRFAMQTIEAGAIVVDFVVEQRG